MDFAIQITCLFVHKQKKTLTLKMEAEYLEFFLAP
jgi:hypothetical protein